MTKDAATTLPAAGTGRRRWYAGTLTYTLSGLVVLFAWLLLGDLSYMMRERSAAPVAQLMLKAYHASDFVTGLFLLTIPWTVILFVSPAVSYWSDRFRSRWGRRIPFLLLPTPFVTLSMFGMGFSPQIGAALQRAFFPQAASADFAVVLVMGVAWTVFEIGVQISNAIYNGLANDVVPRELLGRFYGLFRAVSLAVGVLFNYKIIGHAETHATLILASVGVCYGIGFTLMCVFVREGEYPPPPPAGSPLHPVLGALGDYMRDCFAQPYYLLVFLFLALANLCVGPVNLFSIYAAKSVGMSMETYGRYLVLTYACSFALAFPIGWIADRLHPIRVALLMLFAYAAVMLAGFFAIHHAASFGVVFLLHGVLAGAYATGTAALPQMLFPKEKFAQYAAAAGLVAALGNICLGPTLGYVLDRMHHEYRYTFLAGSAVAGVALLVGCGLFRQWKRLGGAGPARAKQSPPG